MIACGKSKHLRHKMRQRGAMVRAAVGQSNFHGYITIRGQVHVATKNVCSGLSRQFSERLLSFVITHIAAMMLRHAQAKSALESSGCAASHRISLVPTERFSPFLQYLDRGHRF